MELKNISSVVNRRVDNEGQEQGVGAVRAAGDSALGAGQVFSSYAELVLPKYAPRAFSVAAAAPRLLGGLVTLATAGSRIYSTYKEDKMKNDFSNTRREVFVTASSTAGALAVGSVAGAVTAGATALGAPAIVIGGLAVAGVAAAGYAGYKVGNWAYNFYNSR